MEQQLRMRFHQSVDRVQPDPAALLRIRRAVPRRRARHRNVWTGTAAAVLLVAAAVPTIKGVQNLDLAEGPAAGRTIADAEHHSPDMPSEDTVPGRSHLPRPVSSADRSGSAVPGTEVSSAAASPSPGAVGSPVGVEPAPDCVRTDLGEGSSHLGTADGSGKVYGWFTVLNVSGRSCKLTGPGAVVVSATEGTDPAKVKVVDHTAGDPASGLPAPVAGAGPLVLPPKAGYQVRFGWVPDAPCPNPGGGASPGAPAPQTAASAAPDAAASPAASASPSTGPSPSVSPSPAAPASITLAHTPQAGDPAAATAKVGGACSGTVYRAAPEAVPAATPQPSGTPTVSGSG
ncbi:hypothetical protein [Kitasatospora sp. GP82]|uniref:hypothetical protein n=1 Tax=Kitasatospora sp. GP82 TaxID=3035089 RepID=UPI0024732EED|nr:hypothetical protein [Kitasatospora sp. GP82]